jgi:polyhydroxyalkanoate synthase
MFNAALDAQKAVMDVTFKAWERLLALPRAADQALHVRVGATPSEVVHEQDLVKLVRYRNDSPVSLREPLVICPALVNRPYVLDLRPDRSVVRQLLRAGFDVYLIDWGVPGPSDHGLRLQDYVCGLLTGCVEFVRQAADSPMVNLFGCCLGGTLAALFTALHPDRVNTLTLLGAPIDFEQGDGLLRLWTQERFFDVDRLVDVYGNCPAELLNSAFHMLRPVQNYYEKYVNAFDNLQDEKFTESFFALEKWVRDAVPVAGETFREVVKGLYQGNQLVKGEFRLRNRVVRLERINCPLLLLTAEFDRLVPPASTLGIVPHVASRDVKPMSLRAGLIGLALGAGAHREFWPEAAEWIAGRSSTSGIP